VTAHLNIVRLSLPSRSGVVRYNGSPYAQMPLAWSVVNDNNTVSDGYYAQSNTVSQTVSLVFTGTWAGLGYLANTNAGQVEVSIDGVSQGTVDTYAATARPQSAYYNNLASGPHTMTVRILSTRHPNSSGTYFNFDYLDVWDGTTIPSGQAETPFATTWNWARVNDYSGASGGYYYRDGTAMWHAFTGNGVTYQAVAASWAGQVEVSIDGITRGLVSLYNPRSSPARSTIPGWGRARTSCRCGRRAGARLWMRSSPRRRPRRPFPPRP